jgi:16S rRNA (uracil1498-N3)-methyltransferase
MECFIVEPNNIQEEQARLALVGDEAKHAVRSLRMKEGSLLFATDLSGVCYSSKIISVNKLSKDDWEAECEILEKLPNHNESPKHIHLVIGILQQTSKFEEILEKCTELGVKEFTPIYSMRSEKEELNRERSERIIRSATKQVSRATSPVLHQTEAFLIAVLRLREMEYDVIIFHEQIETAEAFTTVDIRAVPTALVIGPEGGFSEEEIEIAKSYGAEVASLGVRRLRAETAAIAACAIALA